MNILLLSGFLIFLPFLLGQGTLAIADEITHRKSSLSTRYLAGFVLMLLSAGAVNAHGAITDTSLSKLIWIWGVLLLGFATLCYLATVIQKIMSFRSNSTAPASADDKAGASGAALLLYLLAGLLILVQMLYLLLGDHISLTGDITPETVSSFLQANGLYRINPLTGSSYTAGVPNRLRFMALPTFYAMLCRIFSLPVDTVVCHIIPAYFLLIGYLSYHILSLVLFPGKDSDAVLRRALFLVLIAVLVFATDSGLGLDGFDLLHAGYRETTLRTWVLVPALIAFLLKRRWVLSLLILAAEAVTVWTLFGTGAGAVIALGLFLCERYLRSRNNRDAAEKEVTE